MSDLRSQLLAIKTERGMLTPAVVVEEARPDDHPLHGRFEWDDTVAGEYWRRVQAHELIRSVRVMFRNKKDEPISTRYFHAIPSESAQPVYEDLDTIIADPIVSEIVLRDMHRQWQALKRRFERFEEFRKMVLADIAA